MTGHIDGGTFEPAADSITHDTVLVNAEIADRWLKANPRNRPIDEGAVLSYAQQMLDGLWRFDGAPIRFDNTGVLLDGQHRLTAITVAASVTLPILVIRGLEPETQGVMDQGKKRTGGNQLHIAGYKHANSVAAVARQLILIDSGMMFRDSKWRLERQQLPPHQGRAVVVSEFTASNGIGVEINEDEQIIFEVPN
ncbi:hypothetical protein, partial [Microbacterium aurantiacum]|uniref:hypothetical protein n=1 Tax=Microbacterium aurantiacum TaxID=162393 RepID=UPI004037C862